MNDQNEPDENLSEENLSEEDLYGTAIIGMAGRFPKANNIDEFWKNLCGGVEGITFYTDEELLEAGVAPELMQDSDYVKAKGEVDHVDLFDASFFGINPKEAELMDPQHRLLMECAWEALENAGYDSLTYDGLIGIFAGKSLDTYAFLNVYPVIRNNISSSFSLQAAIGNDKDSLTTTISYRLNLKGPGITIQTSSSTSLVAVCVACQSLLTYQCEIAIAGGVSCGPPVKSGYVYEEGGIVSPDGHCRAFDAKAKGFVPGLGMGLVVLKRLKDAVLDRDNILAVIKGYGVNNDGSAKVSYTAPSVDAQADVVSTALYTADVHPETIGYIEAHGTGTHLGDPIEIAALTRAFRAETDKKQFCAVGSVKTNVGHLDTAAGVTGLIKTALILKHKIIPPTLHFENPNPEIDFDNSPFYVNRYLCQWDSNGVPRRAGVTSLGMGGTNAHAILEEAPVPASSGESRPWQLILLSAKTNSALETITQNLRSHIDQNGNNNGDVNLADMVYTLKRGRHPFKYRRAVLCKDMADAVVTLKEMPSDRMFDTICDTVDRPVYFMFTGQGSQYVNMGKELYESEPVFKENIDQCAELLVPHLGIDLRKVIYPVEGEKDTVTCSEKLMQTWITQPALFTIEYALAQLWMDWGIKPIGMIGHSIGEFPAACISGCLSLNDALRLVSVRGQLMQNLERGSMISVTANEEVINNLLKEHEDLSLAAVNGPQSCVVSGNTTAIERLENQLREKSIPCKRLRTSHAFHSKMMDPILKEFEKEVRSVELNPPAIPFISSATGTWIKNEEAVDPAYWVKQLRRAVRFSAGINEILKDSHGLLLEVGPGNTLCSFAKQHHDKITNQVFLTTIRHINKNEPDMVFLLKTLGNLWLSGVNIDWKNYYKNEIRNRVPLPTYPFERERYWVEPGKEMNMIREEKSVSYTTSTLDQTEKHNKENHRGRPGLTNRYVEPGDRFERILVDIWEELLGIRPIGIEDDFFELGGQSLNGVLMISRIHKELNIKIPLTRIFEMSRLRELAGFLKGLQKETFEAVEPVEKKEYYRVSSAQKRLYVLQQIEANNTSYNIPNIIFLEGNLDIQKFQGAFKKLVSRHESLRTSFDIISEEPVQIINETAAFEIEYYEASDNAGLKEKIADIMQRFIHPFNLSMAPLLRVGLVKVGEKKNFLLIDMHHIITDGTSQSLLTNEFTAIYGGKELPPMGLQYKDYSEWQQCWVMKKTFKQQQEYWVDFFKGEIPLLDLPCDFPRPAVQSFEGNRLNFEVNKEITDALKRLALEVGATLYMILLTIYNILLAKLSSQEAIIVGTPVAGRRHADLEKIIGMFVNTLALLNQPKGESTFKEFLQQVKEKTVKAFENQDYPYEELVEQVAVNRDISRNPLFDTMFVLQNTDSNVIESPGLKILPFEFEYKTSKFDLTLEGQEVNEKLRFQFEYSTKLFKQETIERFVGYFKNIINLILEDQQCRISELEIISEEEKNRLIFEFNDTAVDYTKNKTVHELFSEQAGKTPDRIAVIDEPVRPVRHVSLSYRELNNRSDQLAHILIEKGVLPDAIIGIMMERSVEMIIGIFGILKSGGAYLPVDPGYPQNRIDYMLKDSGARMLAIANDQEGEKVRRWEGEKVILESIIYDSNHQKGSPRRGLQHSNLVYLIYTSGTTGKPKGVGVYHHGFFNLILWFVNAFGINADDRNLVLTSLSFDLTQKNIFAPLVKGGTSVLSPLDYFDPAGILQIVDRNRVTWFNCTPSMIQKIIESSSNKELKKLAGLRYMFLGGEPISLRALDKWVESEYFKTRIVNTYGPTECTDISASYIVDEPKRFYDGSVPTGKPIHNAALYILDRWFRLQPTGVPGELFIGGDGVGLGYLNRPGLTAEKFIFNRSYRSNRTYILYKTGDLMRWLGDGNIEFLGRIDHQVKIRGYRVELGEIEIRLSNFSGLKEVAVLALEDANRDKYLCAYIVSRTTLDITGLKEYLAKELPDYMIPSYIVPLEKIPLNPHGKIDRRALPKPELKSDEKYIAPRNKIETELVELWSEVLGRDPLHASQLQTSLGIDDNFFQMGGHSLKATILAAKIHKKLNIKLPMAELFKTPTIRGLAKYIMYIMSITDTSETPQEQYEAIQPAEKKKFYVLSPAQKRLYILQQMEMESIAYNMPVIIPLSEETEIDKLAVTFNRLINHHESLRTSFHMIGDEPYQVIHENHEIEFKIEHNENFDGRSFVRAFDLSRAPLIRAAVYQTEDRKRYLLIDMHHIITDGISQEILKKDFALLYMGEHLPQQRLQYKDFAEWRNRPEEKEKIENQKIYWVNEFRGDIPILNLPIDYARPAVQNFEGDTLHFELDAPGNTSLKSLALSEGVTEFMLIMAIINILLSRLSNQEDIIIGTPTAGRRHADLEKIIGMFVNTLALRNYPAGHLSFREFLYDVKERTLAAFENQEYQFEDLVENVIIKRDVSRNPLFDVMVAHQDFNLNADAGNKISATPVSDPLQPDDENWEIVQTAKFDLTIITIEQNESLGGAFQYCTSLFKRETIERFITYLKKIISVISLEPGIRIGEIEIIPEEEKQRLLFEFNKTAVGHLQTKSIPQLFAEQVEKEGDRVAVTGLRQDINGMTYLTYRKLNEISGRLAQLLHEKNVQSGTIVGIMVERSLEMIIGILGILKSGAAYLPINPNFPEERIQYMLKDSGARLLAIANDQEGEKVRRWEGEKVLLEEVCKSPKISSYPLTILPSYLLNSSNLAYIIYTSGSTGKPKGVPITHANFSPLLHWGYKNLGIGAGDRALQNLAYYFDWSVWEIFITLTSGASLYMTPEEILLNPVLCAAFIRQHALTVLHVTPTQFGYLAAVKPGPGTLKYLFIGAEKLSYDLVKRSFEWVDEDCRVFNMYGPTEATIISAVLEIQRADHEKFARLSSVPIGQPAGNAALLILDKYLNVCPLQVGGELYIGGDGVAKGYLNNPELTAEKFKFNRSYRSNRTSILLYKTGDLARWLVDGTIEYLGRIDLQVKIRGHRIELGEIENCLLTHKGIKEAVVTAYESVNGEKDLCAYVVSEETYEGSLSISADLREYLTKKLPPYMIPSHFITIEKIPLNPNGKVDLKALPKPGIVDIDNVYMPPTTAVAVKLAGIWADVLDIEPNTIGRDANFFQMGGHSLKATVMLARIKKELQVNISLIDIFTHPVLDELSTYIEPLAEEKYTPIEPVEKKDYYILSSAQKRIYILQRMEPAAVTYNMPLIIPLALPGVNEIAKLEDIFIRLIERHESFRTSFIMIEEEPMQRIHDQVDFKIEYYDLAAKDAKHHQEKTLLKQFIRPFDLSRAPLLRIGFVKAGENRYLLMMDTHHIISDGVSHDILRKDFMAITSGENLAPLYVQYKDVSEWQAHETQKTILKRQETFWLNTFAEEIPVLNLPLDYPRPAVQSFEGDIVPFEISVEDTHALKTFALTLDITLYMSLLAIFNSLLAKLSGQEDIVVGTPIAGRRYADLEQIIGMFVNTLALRNFPNGEKTINEFLREIKAHTLAAFENQDYPFENLVEKVAVQRDTGRNPLFDVVFSLQNIFKDGNIDPNPIEYEDRTAKFDLTLSAVESGGKLLLEFQYCTRLYKPETIQRFINYFKRTLSVFVESPDMELRRLDIIPEDEKQMILQEFNHTAEYSLNKTIQGLFEAQVAHLPDHIALVGAEEEEKSGVETLCATSLQIQISYRQLDEQANRLAALLVEKGVLPDSIVAIMIGRSIEMIIGILGILKSGAAYLPINPGFPQERIDYMLKDSGARLLAIANDQEGEKVRRWEGEKVILESIIYDSNYQKGHPRRGLQHSNLAYVIYTSGSTGKPKGVPITHANFSPLLHWGYKHLGIGAGDRALQNLAFYFDWSVWEIFITLTSGADLCIVPEHVLLNPESCTSIITRQRITVLHATPTQFRYLAQTQTAHRLESLKYLFIGAEKLSLELAKQSFELVTDQCRVFNMYGPTECTIIAAVLKIVPHELEQLAYISSVPIGRPAGNAVLLVLDKYSILCPLQVGGELYIGGDGVAKGYLNNPELTEKKFKFNRSYRSNRTSILLYKTGDLARWLGNGTIEFLGRIDQQVKIRGFRIELEEIETRISSHPAVRETIVLVKEEVTGEKYICAYLVLAPGKEQEPVFEEIRQYLAGSLPDYMVPAYFMQIEKIPLTPNGKLDQRALPEPRNKMTEKYKAPGDEIEKTLVGIWSEILEIPGDIISIDADFFQLGGHSLKATVLVTRLQKTFNVVVPLIEVFTRATIELQAEYIRRIKNVSILQEEKNNNMVLLKPGGGDENLFFIHDGSGEVEGYLEFCKQLTRPFNCWGLRFACDRDEKQEFRHITIEQLAQTYIERIQVLQPRGPYRFVGWSIGGTAAFEMTLQLEKMGMKVAFLGLIDSPGPGAVFADDANEIKDVGVYQLDIVKTLVNARSQYVPSQKILTPLQYLFADQSPAALWESWSDYCSHTVQSYPLAGDHFSIMKNPAVKQTVKTFESILAKWGGAPTFCTTPIKKKISEV